MNTIRQRFGLRSLQFLFQDLTFFNGVMGMISLGQAVRMWMPDTLFNRVGYELLKNDGPGENWFALIPFLHWAGCFFRYYWHDDFFGRNWFWRVGQGTHLFGAFAFALPALSISVSFQTIGLQTIGFLFITAVMLWQIARTDV